MSMADHLAADGFKDAGYEFVNIDVSEHASRRRRSKKNPAFNNQKMDWKEEGERGGKEIIAEQEARQIISSQCHFEFVCT